MRQIRYVHATLWLLVSLLVELRGYGEDAERVQQAFETDAGPFLKTYCVRCHNADKMKSGVRVDHLDGLLADGNLRLWEVIEELVAEGEMPPEDEKQPSPEERAQLQDWIGSALHMARSRDVARDGSVRRLTVTQYRDSLAELLGLEEDLSALLPPEAVSRDGFTNNRDVMLLSPLLLESYFEIADQALDRVLVDESSRPTVQNFRMDLGRRINPNPLPEKLILGANSHLLRNEDFLVTELSPRKPFDYVPFAMQRKFRFIEGYQGNSTVRGWRDYDSIYHAVYACFRGSPGYPLGNPYDVVPGGLLLRPAIPSAELFQVESTYGPKANFKVSLRQLPDGGRFRVTVKAAKYDDGMLLDEGASPIGEGIVVRDPADRAHEIRVDHAGVYQMEIYRRPPPGGGVAPRFEGLEAGLVARWSFEEELGKSPFGQSLRVKEADQAREVVRDAKLRVGTEPFTVAGWIHPAQLTPSGLVSLGRHERQGWVLDQADNRGTLRFRAFRDYQESSGAFQTKPGVLQKGKWQHIAAVIGRGPGEAKLYVNGYLVASGSVGPDNLDDLQTNLLLGSTPEGRVFKGRMDEFVLYDRALDSPALQALIEPGREFAEPPPDGRQQISLRVGGRSLAGTLNQAAFAVMRLPAGEHSVQMKYEGLWPIDRLVLAPLEDTVTFEQFERRAPLLGVHLGLRRDCGSTLNPVGAPRPVRSSVTETFVFEGALNNFPRPDVEKDNVNYISGLREIGVRSEYTDGRPRPRLLVQSVEFEGPFYETWPPATHRAIFTSSEPESVIRDFATRAFRRPVTETELESLMSVYQASYQAGAGWQQSVRDVLMVVLTSPQFLFLIEESQGPESELLDSYELASKLAYFLWNSGPDQALLDQASRGDLLDGLAPTVDRMIDDPKFERFAAAFVTEWLDIGKLATVETDRKLYPGLTRDVKTQLGLEPVRFVEFLIRENLPVSHLVQSEWVVTNEVLADYYQLDSSVESGFEFVPVRHGKTHLGGVLSQAGILAALTDGREANPVKRGAWLARKIIAKPPADPPPNVPELSTDEDELTLREKLERHRNQEGCAKCHEGIDPWGLPFEAFDAGGLYVGEGGRDASSTLPDRTQVAGLNDLRTYLSGPGQSWVTFSFLKHLATYAVGRDLKYNEVEFLREKAEAPPKSQEGLRDLVQFVVRSDLFLKK